MKTFRTFIKESNFSAGTGVRGFGDVTGTPATNDDSENSHIQRVVQGATEHGQYVKDYLDNHTNIHNGTSVLDEPEDDNWWAKAGAKGSALTALGRAKSRLSEENGGGAPANATGSAVAGTTGDPPVSVAAQMKHTRKNNILRRKPPVKVG